MTTFDQHVQRALDGLPKWVAGRLENIAVVVEDEDLDEPDLYGVFDAPEFLPARVAIFRRPLEDDFGDRPDELERQIRITVLHELAHYFGLEEDRLEELGYE